MAGLSIVYVHVNSSRMRLIEHWNGSKLKASKPQVIELCDCITHTTVRVTNHTVLILVAPKLP